MKHFLPALMLFSISATAQVTDKIPGTDCDNVVHDKLKEVGAPNRSPSSCEIMFDSTVRTRLQNAMGKLLREWSARDWELSDTIIYEVKDLPKSSEKRFYWLSKELKIDSKQTSQLYQSWAKKFSSVMDEFRNKPTEASAQDLKDVQYKSNGDLHIQFHIIVNNPSSEIFYFKGGQRPIKVDGTAYAVMGHYAAPVSGGGVDDSKDACLILFGNPKVSIRKDGNGGETVSAQNIFPKSSHLTVQQISIRIECSEEILQQVLKQIDFNAIAKMIGN